VSMWRMRRMRGGGASLCLAMMLLTWPKRMKRLMPEGGGGGV